MMHLFSSVAKINQAEPPHRLLRLYGRLYRGVCGHSSTGSVIGTGVARRASAVRWGVAANVVAAWFITIPMCAAVGALFYGLTLLF